MGTKRGHLAKACMAATAGVLGVCLTATSASASWIVDCCPITSQYVGSVRYSHTYSYAHVVAKTKRGATAYAQQDFRGIYAFAIGKGKWATAKISGSAQDHRDIAWIKGGIH